MAFVAQAIIYIVETAFLVGIAGSAIVIAISFIDDFRELKGDE